VRHIGVDLHKKNFVACFLAADDTQRLETYPLTRDGLACFKRRLGSGSFSMLNKDGDFSLCVL
jgi:hypothetical protein